MVMIYKTFRAEVKGVNADEGTVDMFIPVSTAEWDRDQEVVEPLAFKKTLPKFMKRAILVSSHDYKTLMKQIGEWPKLKIAETGFEGKPKYYINEGNEEADWGFKLASKGMAAFSIGFIPKVWEDGDGVKEPRRTYKEVELLEISQVIVPSNREAIQSIRSKSVDPVITELCDAVESEIPKEGIIILDLVTKPEETENFIRIPVDTGNHEGHRIRTIEISAKEGISAIYCGTCKKVMTYLFAKDHGWTMAKARAWVKEHEGKSLEVEHEISQEEIIDEFDYLNTLIVTEGISDKAKPAMWILVKEILRLSGDDIPVDIKVLIKPDVSPIAEIKPINETFTNSDILEAIKRIANKTEVK